MPQQVTVNLTTVDNGYGVSVSPWQVEVFTDPAHGPQDIEWTCTENGTAIDPVKIVFFSNHFAEKKPTGKSPLNSGKVKTDQSGPKVDQVYRYRIRLYHGKGSPKPFVIDPEYVRRGDI